MRRPLPILALALTLAGAAQAGEAAPCARLALWGDGEHDDTAALNAWFRGEPVVWAQTREPVGPIVADRMFHLSDEIIVPSGTGRALLNFRMVWPRRPETVSGGAIRAGSDPEQPPRTTAVTIVGGDAGEGVPYEAPDPPKSGIDSRAACLIS